MGNPKAAAGPSVAGAATIRRKGPENHGADRLEERRAARRACAATRLKEAPARVRRSADADSVRGVARRARRGARKQVAVQLGA